MSIGITALFIVISSIFGGLTYLFSSYWDGDENNTKLFQDYNMILYENGLKRKEGGGGEEDLSVLFQKVKKPSPKGIDR